MMIGSFGNTICIGVWKIQTIKNEFSIYISMANGIENVLKEYQKIYPHAKVLSIEHAGIGELNTSWIEEKNKEKALASKWDTLDSLKPMFLRPSVLGVHFDKFLALEAAKMLGYEINPELLNHIFDLEQRAVTLNIPEGIPKSLKSNEV